MKRLPLYLFITLLLFLSNSLNALTFNNSFININLSNRCILMSAKSNDGYLWFATRDGIDKYNGDTYKHYELINNKHCIAEYPRGIIKLNNKICAFSEKNIYYYITSKDNFFKINANGCFKYTSINVIACDKNNTLWIGTDNYLCYIKNNDSIPHIVKNRINVYSITFNKNNHCWIGTSKGLYEITKSNNKDILYRNKAVSQLNNIRIQTTFFDELTKTLWIGTFSNGLYRYNTLNKKLISNANSSKQQPIRTITDVNKNNIWVGIDGDGIYEFDRTSGVIKNRFTQDGEVNNYIRVNNIYHIFNDKRQIYVCTYTGGVFVYNKNPLVQYLFNNKNHSIQAIVNNHVNCILEDKNNRIWFGTNNGISRFNPITNQWKHFRQGNNSIILAIFQDQHGNIWSGGYGCEINYIDTNDNIHFLDLPQSYPRQLYTYAIYADENNNIWFGGNIYNLMCYNTNTKKLKNYPINFINAIERLNKEQFIISTNKRIYILNIKDGKYINIWPPKNNLSAFHYIQKLVISPKRKNELWIGTEGGGIVKLNIKDNTYQTFNQTNGITSNNICGMQFDFNGNLWISTEKGLNCLNPYKNNIATFYEFDGLPDNIHSFRSQCILNNGNIIFGTPSGAYEINPSKYSLTSRDSYNLRFEEFDIFNVPILPTQKGSILSTVIDRTNNITLKHFQHSFTFKFTNVDFLNVSKSLYSWYLEGFDKIWKTPSEQHDAVYTNIQPGDYIFHVRVYDMGNSNNFQERTINITILQPWYNTWIAWLIYISIIILIAYYIFKFYKNKLEAKDSDQKIRFFVNIAHDIRTPLTLIKAPLNEIEEDEKLSDNGKMALNLAQRNIKKLLNIVNQLLDFQKIEREAMKLQIEESNIYTLISNIISNFEPLAHEKSISLHKVFSFDNKTIGYIDQYKISIILDNLISNAIKYTNNNGNVWIKCSINNNLLNINIIDDGIGISVNGQKKLFNRFYRAQNAENSKETGSGIGLLLTKKMIQLHKGNINFSSREGIGTTFSFNIPIDKDSYSKNELIKIKPLVNDNKQTSLDKSDKNKYKLLIVEDNKELCDYLSHCLEDDYIIIKSYNGEEGFEAVKKDSPDFIISDIMMPILSGLDLCKKIKSNIETCHIPIILLTSLTEREDIIKGLDAGADDYITKPFEMAILKRKICGIIRNRQLFRKKYIDKSAFTNDTVGINELDKIFMSKVVEKIESEMANENFSIDLLAMDMAMSRSVFFKKIKSLTEQSPQDFIRDIKMKKAASLLLEKKYSIGEIAYLTGYPNSKYFSTTFKKYYGKTPSGYVTDITN